MDPPELPEGTVFRRGPGKYKYAVKIPGRRVVYFGDKRYQHYRDQTPRKMGGALWINLDHRDQMRRANYRSRHRSILTKDGTPSYMVEYSPAWFSWWFLW